MGVLLKPDTFTVLTASRILDEHGWAETPILTEIGTQQGTLQEDTPANDPQALGSGAGPAAPDHRRLGTAFLEEEVLPGDILRVRGVDWRVQACRFTEDPTGSGLLNCWVAPVSEVTYGDE
jgi:hypothetical protein